jgi:hypothetical protein
VAESNAASSRFAAAGPFWSSWRGLALLAALLLVAVGPAVFRTLNRVWDNGPSRPFAGIVTRKYASKGEGRYLTLKGAPNLPTADNTMDVNVSVRDYDDAPLGDSVFVVAKPGFFGRPWIVSYRVQTDQDRVQELLERHHALERGGRHQLTHP